MITKIWYYSYYLIMEKLAYIQNIISDNIVDIDIMMVRNKKRFRHVGHVKH